jgi:HAE1 family hydrophobic/amphiphilic exporter-1
MSIWDPQNALPGPAEKKTDDKSENHNQSSDLRYLETLTFRPELRKTWLNFFVSNFRVVILLIVLISGIGIYSFLQLPRESNPEVKIPIAVVFTTYPGVAPADMEELVTKKIETGIAGLKGIKTITSNSANSVSSIVVEFDASQNLDDSIRKLRDQVTSVKKDLPADANEPAVQEISFDDTPIWTIALTGPYDDFTLRKYAEDLQDELEKIPGVREAKVSGGDQLEFSVAYDPDKLASFGVTIDQANQAVRAVNLAVPAGSFEGETFTYPVRSDSRFFTIKNLEQVPVAHADDGSIVYLKDIAKVETKAIKRTILSRLSSKGGEPKNAVTVDIIKKTGGSILNTIDQAKTTTDSMITKFRPGVSYEVIVDQGRRITLDFNQLTHDFLLTLALVFGILFLIVGLKEAFVAGLAVPLVFFVSFSVMLATGISLNFLSIFSLILSLGLLVDDAIVVVSATKQYLRTGKFTPEEAVLLVLNDFKVVLTTTTLTTIWAFLPLLLSTGIIGEFIKSIPITVSVTLFASLLIALMVNHPLAAVLERIRLTKRLFFLYIFLLASALVSALFLKSIIGYGITVLSAVIIFSMLRWYARGGREHLLENAILAATEWNDDEAVKKKLREAGGTAKTNFSSRLIHGIINFNRILPYYEKYLRMIIESRKTRLATLAFTGILFILAVLLPVTGIVPSEFFPASNEDLIFVNLRASTGLNLNETDKIVSQMEEKLRKYPEIVNFSTIVGNAGVDQNGAGGPTSNSSNLAGITVNLLPKEERKIKSYEVADILREDFKSIQGGDITVASLSGGPPSGAAFQAQISGDDLATLDRVATDLKPLLTGIEGVISADISLKDSPAEYTFNLNPAKLELYNLNAAYVGSVLRTAISGSEISTVILGGKEVKVMASFAENKIPDLRAIENLQILNLRKQPVYLKDVAKIELRPSVDSVLRINQKRTVTLTGNIDETTRPAAVLSEFQKKLSDNYKLPAGYGITYGGENEQNTESVISIIRAMVLAGLLIISTLIIQFNSFKKAMIVLVTIPLALIGVFIGMALARVNLSFPGLIGILALFGIVVKNAIILMDKINLNLHSGIPFIESIIDAGKSRMEAIFITSIATILGIVPITLSNELWMALGGAVIFGLMLSSFLTLFIVPTLFVTLIKEKDKI